MIKFLEDGHRYIDDNNTSWRGVTTTISKFHEKFSTTPEACSVRRPTKDKPNKWFGVAPTEIAEAWKSENERSTFLGHNYHKTQEDNPKNPNNLPIYRCEYEGDAKIAGTQKLVEGIYIEWILFLKSIQLIGQADRVDVYGNKFSVLDFKTCKEIKKESYVGWEGHKMMLDPISHIQDSNYWHYALQLSIYATMIMTHNPNLKLDKLILRHILFEGIGQDKWGYPIYKIENGNPIVKDEVDYEMPFLKSEVQSIFKALKQQ